MTRHNTITKRYRYKVENLEWIHKIPASNVPSDPLRKTPLENQEVSIGTHNTYNSRSVSHFLDAHAVRTRWPNDFQTFFVVQLFSEYVISFKGVYNFNILYIIEPHGRGGQAMIVSRKYNVRPEIV